MYSLYNENRKNTLLDFLALALALALALVFALPSLLPLPFPLPLPWRMCSSNIEEKRLQDNPLMCKIASHSIALNCILGCIGWTCTEFELSDKYLSCIQIDKP